MVDPVMGAFLADKARATPWSETAGHAVWESSSQIVAGWGQPSNRRQAVADRVRVGCVNKSNRTDPHERISHIGGTNPNGNPWKLTESDAIAGIEQGRWAFYVERPTGRAVDVIVAVRLGRKYLKTTADGERPDNLLALPECP